jgi:integrase
MAAPTTSGVAGEEARAMTGRKNPPLVFLPIPEGTPVTFDTMAQAYLEDYVLQRYRALTTARARVEHLRAYFGGWPVERLTPDGVRSYQLQRRHAGAAAATISRETSILSRMFQIAVRRGQVERIPLFPTRLEENPPRERFFEHDEFLKVCAHLPSSYCDVLQFAYYSGWRRNEILHLT